MFIVFFIKKTNTVYTNSDDLDFNGLCGKETQMSQPPIFFFFKNKILSRSSRPTVILLLLVEVFDFKQTFYCLTVIHY